METRALARLRTLVTLGVLIALVLLAVAWGWSALTTPFPTSEEAAVCEDQTIAAGDNLRPEDLTVSVLNAGDRVGLASSTMNALEGRGFGVGERANAPTGTDVRTVQIWTDQPKSPAVRLLVTYLGKKTEVVERTPVAAGLNVVVGDGFGQVRKGRNRIVPRQDIVVCSPVAPATDLPASG